MSIYLESVIRTAMVFTWLKLVVIWLKGPKHGDPIVQLIDFWVNILAHLVLGCLIH